MSALIRAMVLRKRQSEALVAQLEARHSAIVEAAKGETGAIGAKPDHEWKGTKLRFEKPDGTWGELVDLKGKDGKAGERITILSGGSAASPTQATAVSEIFILDVTPTGTGQVASKTYLDGGEELDSCLSDTNNVRVHIGCSGGADKYAPSVTINGVSAIVTESSTKRWFTGYADLVLEGGVTTLVAESDDGGSDTALIEVLGLGPNVLSVAFGPYPGAQTELKQGDMIFVTVTTPIDAVAVLIDGINVPVVAGSASTTISIGSGTGLVPVTVSARNAFGTYGLPFTSEPLNLNQSRPTFGAMTVTYPAGKGSFDAADVGSVSCQVTNYDTISYTSPDLAIDTPTLYAATKLVTNTQVGYVNGAINYTITAVRAANNATATKTGSVKIATVQATATISVNPTGRMSTSPSGVSYSVRIHPSQALASAPTLVAPIGTWSGNWVLVDNYWQCDLVLRDADARGVSNFGPLHMVGLSNIVSDTISGSTAYTVGGFSNRTLTFPAFSRVAAIGTSVADASKLSAAINGVPLLLYGDNAIHTSGFYPANADGSYNANGAYIGLSDSVFAGSNTTGMLQVTVQEVA